MIPRVNDFYGALVFFILFLQKLKYFFDIQNTQLNIYCDRRSVSRDIEKTDRKFCAENGEYTRKFR